MDVSNCPDCKRALKKALLKGDDPSKLKMKDGHLVGCPSLSPQPAEPKEAPDAVRRPQTAAPPTPATEQGWPWAEGQYRIVPPQRPPLDPTEGGTHGGGRGGDVPAHREPTGSADRSTPPRPAQPGRRSGSDRPVQPRGRAGVHGNRYAEAEAAAARPQQQIQQFKVVDHANSGEQRDHRKGAWFVAIVVIALLVAPVFPPIMLIALGAIVTLLVIR